MTDEKISKDEKYFPDKKEIIRILSSVISDCITRIIRNAMDPIQ